MRNELLTNHRRDIKTQGEGRWTRQGWIYPMFDVIRHIFIIPLQNKRNSKGENIISITPPPSHNTHKSTNACSTLISEVINFCTVHWALLWVTIRIDEAPIFRFLMES